MWKSFATDAILISRSAVLPFLKGFGKSHKKFLWAALEACHS
jgi:hypothetical protein